MKLFLMRHANTENAGSKADLEREITKIGEEEALKSAMFLKEFSIDKALISYVKRAIQTSDIIAQQIKIPEVDIVTELYQDDEKKARDLIASQNNKYKNILVIGHNPVIYRLSLGFSNTDSKNYEELLHQGMVTAKVVVIDFHQASSWEQINHIKGDIIYTFASFNNRHLY
jgi:phosphohistidine phosphatase SixA